MNGIRLLGVPEIAELLEISRQRADQLSKQDGFPAPVQEVGRRKFWSYLEIHAWASSRSRIINE